MKGKVSWLKKSSDKLLQWLVVNAKDETIPQPKIGKSIKIDWN